jgi:non-ribosomal peptide synthetase component F/thioesterase domain-containing protein/SAM-dependent methyltransferase
MKPEDIEDVYPLTPMQEGMLFHTLRHPESAVYLQQVAVTYRGALDVDSLREAWQAVVDRHPALRTAFAWQRLDKPVQLVSRAARVTFAELDWRGLDDAGWAAREDELLADGRRRGLDLATAPLLRFTLARLAGDRHRLLVDMHHLVLDGWSTGVVLREAAAAYAALRAGRRPDLGPVRPFRAYVDWLRARDPAAGRAFWSQELAGLGEPARLLRDRRPSAPGAGREQHARALGLGRERTAALLSAGREQRITLSALLQGAWAVLLSRYAGRPDVVFGSVSSGRPAGLEGVEDVVGLLVDTVPTRLHVDPERPAGAWLRSVQARTAAAREFEHVPLTAIREWAGLPAGGDMFETVQVLQNLGADPLGSLFGGLGDVRVEQLRYHTRTSYPLTLACIPGEELTLRASYDPAWLEDAAAERLLGHLATLLGELPADPERPLGRVPMLTEPERALVAAWSEGTQAPAPARPEAVAVEQGGRLLARADVEARAGRLARRLRARGIGRDSVVGLWLPRSPDLVVAVLAALRAGGAVLPLDPAAPPDRTAQVLEEARPGLLVAAAGEPVPAGVPILVADADDGESAGEPPGDPDPDALAWVAVDLAGGTRSHGVQVRHATLARLVAAQLAAFGLGPDDRVAQLAPPGSPNAVFEVLLALGSGARLLLPEAGRGPLAAFRELTGAGATCALVTPALLAALSRDGVPAAPRTLIVHGEPLSPDLSRRWAPGRRLLSLYGPAEAGAMAAVAGRPVAGVRVRILDAGGLPVPAGVPGELHLGGEALGPGYHNRPDLTLRRFGPDPLSGDPRARLFRTGEIARWTETGELELLAGASDEAEVEDRLRRHPGVAWAAADGPVAYVLPAPAGPEAPGEAADGAEQVGQWRDLYEHTYSGAGRAPDPAFDTVGWNSSYTGAPLAEAEMREWVDGTRARLRRLAPRRMLEIGCGTGMLLLAMAPGCEECWATDVSPAALAAVRRCAGGSVTLLERAADDFSGIPEAHFDLVVLNSVAQYFPSGAYLRRVLEGAQRALRPGGRVFVGDVRSLPLLDELHVSLQLANSPADMEAGELWRLASEAARQEEELVLHPDFFRRFAAESGRECAVRVAARRGRAHNELTRFRYDVVLGFEPAPAPEAALELDWEAGGLDPERLGRLLAGGPESVLVRRLPNARVAGLTHVTALLAGGLRAATAGELAELAAAPAVEPEDVVALGERAGYEVELPLEPGAARLAALLTRPRAGSAPAWPAWPEPRPWAGCANDPLAHRREARLVAGLRSSLEADLHPHLVPETIVVLRDLPLAADGRADRSALPGPGRARRAGAAGHVAPRDAVELVVARTWEEVLGVRPIGVRDDFFELGGHSLTAMRVVSRLQRRFDRGLELGVLLREATVEAVAAVLRQDAGARRSPLLTLRPEGELAPFFCVHPSTANSLVYQELADRLGPDQPFHMLDERDLARFDRLEDLAAHYVAAIRAAAPRGPYRLGGLSFGGTVAFEAARQLEAAGERVDLVAMFDAELPRRLPEGAVPAAEAAADLHLHFLRVFELVFHRTVPVPRERLVALDEEGQRRLLYELARSTFDGGAVLEQAMEAAVHARRLLVAYRPERSGLPVCLYVGDVPTHPDLVDPEFDWRDDRTAGWGAVCERLQVVSTPGDHLTSLAPPNVDVLAGHLRGLLESAAVAAAP